ncbi:rab1 small GTP-binding protein, partial [Trypanosoma theileri]
LGRNNKQVRAIDIIDVNDLGKWATASWTLPEPVTQGLCAPFKGHNIIHRSHRTRVATKEEEERLPLQQVDVGTLSIKWIRERMNNKAKKRWDEVWGIMQTPTPTVMDRES